jgi:hypothetical protein
MSKEMLRTVLETKEASAMDVLRGSLRRALGAGAGAGAAVPTLEAVGLEQSNPLFWGLVTGAGVLGHDLAGAAGKGYSKHLQKVSCARRDKKILLQKLAKCSKGRKKRAEMIKEGPYKKEYSLTKKASLSRAAKGAIAAPLGIMGAAAVHPELFGHVQNIGILDNVAGRVLGSLDNLAKPVLGDTLGQSTNALASLGGLSALGAGAGKLSERLAPVAKKSFLEDPRNRKMLLAASLFPWVSTAAGATYLANRAMDSDS